MFLLGMIIMTDGLKTLAGDSMRAALMRFTRSPLSGAVTGTLCTALLQSSSATTVAAVGFVSAGLVTFPQALGVIFGANIGTTVTGWLVALLGLKLQLGTVLLPLVFLGAVVKLFSRTRLAAVGYAVAGFSLIFVGITQMQVAMAGMEGLITPANLPADTWLGRLQLIGLGALATVITQSSSAGVAATLTLLYAGVIRFEQAAALVIGMDVGTTVTAVLATLGGSVEARRTGLSHVIYNLMTAVLALLLITPYILLWQWLAPGRLISQAEIALVAFHTAFNTVGVIAVLPFTYRFAALLESLIPGLTPVRIDRLDQDLLPQPSLALSAAQQSALQAVTVFFNHLRALIERVPQSTRVDLARLELSLNNIHSYLDNIHLRAEAGADWTRLIALMHAFDHMQRLHERFEEDEDRAVTARTTEELADECDQLIRAADEALICLENQHWFGAHKQLAAAAKVIAEEVERYRAEVVDQMAAGELSVPNGTDCLEAIRWLERVSRHLERIVYHLGQAALAAGVKVDADGA